MPATPDDLFECLDRLGISHTTLWHPAVFTVAEARLHCHAIEGGHAKNLFLRDKKRRMFLVVTLADKPLKIKELGRVIGAQTLSFANQDLLLEVLGVEPGSVTPFAAMNIRDHVVDIILDQEMMAWDPLNFHPLTNTATTTIAGQDLVRFLEHLGHGPRIISL